MRSKLAESECADPLLLRLGRIFPIAGKAFAIVLTLWPRKKFRFANIMNGNRSLIVWLAEKCGQDEIDWTVSLFLPLSPSLSTVGVSLCQLPLASVS